METSNETTELTQAEVSERVRQFLDLPDDDQQMESLIWDEENETALVRILVGDASVLNKKIFGDYHPSQDQFETLEEVLQEYFDEENGYAVYHEGDLFFERQLSLSEFKEGFTFITSDDFDEWKDHYFPSDREYAFFTWILEQSDDPEDDYNAGIGNTITHGSREYLVVTDDDADQLWDEYLDNVLDDCFLPELPETLQRYFDRDAWKRDAKIDGRGHSLSSYDGEEHEIKLGDEYWYIYRTN